MSIMNYISFDKPIKDYIEIGDGYILKVDSRFKDKDNNMIINEDDYSSVIMNGNKIDCQFILGDVPHAPIFAIHGEQVEPIVGGNPLSYNENITQDGVTFKSVNNECQCTLITDPATGERHINYGPATLPGNIVKYEPAIETNFILDYNLDVCDIDVKKCENGWYRCIIYGMNNASWIRTGMNSGSGMRGNLYMKCIPSDDVMVQGVTDINPTNEVNRLGTLSIKGRDYIYNNFKINTDVNSQYPFFGTYFNLFRRNLPTDKYITGIVYIKDYILEKNYNFYRGSHSITTTGNLTGMKANKPIDMNTKSYYIYFELWSIIEVYNPSPTFIASSDITNESNPLTINSQYFPHSGLNGKFKQNEINRVLIHCTPPVPADGYSVEEVYINGTLVNTDSWLRNSKVFENIILAAINFRQPSLENVRQMMIFEDTGSNIWTPEYCTQITTNGFPNNKYSPKASIINLDKVEHYMDIGDTVNFTSKVLPDTCKNKIVTCYSNNRDVLRNEPDNSLDTLKSYKEGIAVVTAVSNDNTNITDSCVVRVIKDYNKIANSDLVCWIDARDQVNNDSPTLTDRMFNQNLDMVNLNFSESAPKLSTNGNAIIFNNNRHVFTQLRAGLSCYTMEIRVAIDFAATPLWTDLISLRKHTNIEVAAANVLMHDVINANFSIWLEVGYNTVSLVVDMFAGTSKVYVNGVFVSEGKNEDKGGVKHEKHLFIMMHTTPENTGRFVVGKVGSFKLYRRELTPEEIIQNHNYETSVTRDL